jgi:hypothetical protein
MLLGKLLLILNIVTQPSKVLHHKLSLIHLDSFAKSSALQLFNLIFSVISQLLLLISLKEQC